MLLIFPGKNLYNNEHVAIKLVSSGFSRLYPGMNKLQSAVISYLGAKYSESYPVKLIFGVNRPLNFNEIGKQGRIGLASTF